MLLDLYLVKVMWKFTQSNLNIGNLLTFFGVLLAFVIYLTLIYVILKQPVNDLDPIDTESNEEGRVVSLISEHIFIDCG